MTKNVVTIEDLSNDEILSIFRQADKFLHMETEPSPLKSNTPVAIRRTHTIASDFILATLFYEPSTRTRLSFECAMHRLGGRVISSAEASSSSSAKGETIADTIRVVENYADAIVLRHPAEGAARVAADFATIPVINAGDGSHEHPTQTLCDLFTLYKTKGSLDDLSVLICGDLKNGRTVHSLVYALARFGIRILTSSAPGLELPDHVRHRLTAEYGATVVDAPSSASPEVPIDAVYATPERPHQLTLIPDLEVQISARRENIDFCYVTRFQSERMPERGALPPYPKVDREFLKKIKSRNASVLHPLPRVNELGYDMDEDPRGMYFQQAAYGVPVRMALLASLFTASMGFSGQRTAAYSEYCHSDTLSCKNDACVTRAEEERRHLQARFAVIDEEEPRFRCRFCEHEMVPTAFGRVGSRKYSTAWRTVRRDGGFDKLLFFNSPRDAEQRGYSVRHLKATTR